MNPILKYASALSITGGALFGAYRHGCSVSAAAYELKITQAKQQHAQQLAQLEASARADEQARAATMHQIDQQTIKGQTDEIAQRDRTIADYRNGSVRLRGHFACAASTDQRVPGTAAGGGQRDAAGAGGLQQPDVEFLVRLASEADQAVTQLAACQAVVRADRGERRPHEISMPSVPAGDTAGLGRSQENPQQEPNGRTSETASSITKPAAKQANSWTDSTMNEKITRDAQGNLVRGTAMLATAEVSPAWAAIGMQFWRTFEHELKWQTR